MRDKLSIFARMGKKSFLGNHLIPIVKIRQSIASD
jgi:hypothetical protein